MDVAIAGGRAQIAQRLTSLASTIVRGDLPAVETAAGPVGG